MTIVPVRMLGKHSAEPTGMIVKRVNTNTNAWFAKAINILDRVKSDIPNNSALRRPMRSIRNPPNTPRTCNDANIDNIHVY